MTGPAPLSPTPFFAAMLFDCDGVLVDSEGITNQVLRQKLEESGWRLSYEECFAIFHGKAVRDETARIEAETGQPLTDDWMADFYARRNLRLQAELLAEPGAIATVQGMHALFGGRIACASGADRFKLDLQLRKVGLQEYFEGRVFSGQELARNKPAPDVYLAAAAALGVPSQRCMVVEDSIPGITAGVAAGAAVIAYDKHGQATDAMRAAGAVCVIRHMQDAPQAVAMLMRACR